VAKATGLTEDAVKITELDPSQPDLSALASSEVLLADPGLIINHIDVLNANCRWLSSTWAGVEKIIRHINEHGSSPPWQLTRFAGYFGPAMAEYVCTHILARERHLQHYAEEQKAKRWRGNDPHAPLLEYRMLKNLSVGIMGLGEIGKDVAHVCSLLGMSVAGLVTRPPTSPLPGIKYYTTAQLPELLASSDYIVNILPSTSGTIGLLNGGMLSNCKAKQGCFINVGRGDIVTEEDLLKAIDAKELGGAVLDVFSTEPLPQSSRLWATPNVTLTPHVAAISFPDEVAESFAKNYHLYCTDPSSMTHTVNFGKGY